jgi:hypothetical protein
MNKEKFEILKQKQEEIKKMKQEMLEASNKIFTDLTKDIFVEHPKVKSFGWSQYTPYFNDGDTCYFSVHTDYIYINGESADESNWINETNITNYGTWNREKKVYEGRTEVPNLNYDPDLSKANDEIREFLRNFDDDFFLAQFGDHAEITITADGISIDECEHD